MWVQLYVITEGRLCATRSAPLVTTSHKVSAERMIVCDARHGTAPLRPRGTVRGALRWPSSASTPCSPSAGSSPRAPAPRRRSWPARCAWAAASGERAAKPGQLVAEDVEVAVDERPRFVSRGGIKLANALAATGIDPAGRRCLDVGASTGGFTDCLLQRGAAHVVALDVAYGELDWSLRTDERVTVLERTNARALAAGDLPYAPTSWWPTSPSSR